MQKNAKSIHDLRQDLARDIYFECKYARYRLAKIIEVRSYANNTLNMEELLEVVDYVDKKIEEFRCTYLWLKQKKMLEQAEQKIQNKMQVKEVS